MQKLGVTVIENMIRAKITNRELDFILHIARFQNEYGIITGVHYKDVCEAIDLSYQGFYDCKKSLEAKGIISCEKNNYFDWDITIIGNSFKGKENYGRGYISLGCDMVRDPDFRHLKVNSKLLALLLMRDWQIGVKKLKRKSFQILKENFINKYKELFGVTKRMIRSYLGELKGFVSVYLEEGRKYYITFKEKAVKRSLNRSENDELRNHDIKVGYRRNRIKEIEQQTQKDIIKILEQHHNMIQKCFDFNLSEIFRKSLEFANQGRKKWRRKLSAPLIHKFLLEEINA